MLRMGGRASWGNAGMLLLVWQFALWGEARCGYRTAAAVTAPPAPPPRDPARHVSTAGTCAELREALEDPGPSGDVFMVEDVLCDHSSWGDDAVILSSHVTIIGIRGHRNAMPTLTFQGIKKGIVVTGTARLVFQTINFNDDTSEGIPNEESVVPRPPLAVAVHKNGVVDFVGSWVCCNGCGLAQHKVYVDHIPELGDDNETSLVENFLSTGGIETLRGSGSQGPSPVDGVHTEWDEGSFANGGIYHICASTMICKPDPTAYSAFTYFVDGAIDVCKSRPTVIVLHGDAKKESETPMVMQILAFCVPSLVCIILFLLFLGFLWRSHVKKKGNAIGTQIHESSQTQQDTSQPGGFRGGSRTPGFQSEEHLRLRHQSHQSNSERGSPTSFSFGGIQVDLSKLLGRGGFSSVYKGTFQGNVAAIKIVEHSLQSKAGSSGELAEAKLHRDLYHPYIVITYCCESIPVDSLPSNYSPQGSPTISLGLSSSTTPGKITLSSSGKASWNHSSEGTAEKMCTLIVMEYCERGNLFEAIHDCEFFKQGIRGAPDLPVILRAALDVAAAMCYLHSKGVVHGDLKPENVLRKTLAEDDRGYICKVSDFGLSRTILVDNFLQTATKGTITHMPPEVLQDGLLSPSTDVYSFGIMLWEMISGGFPFNAMGQKDIMLAVVGGFRPPMPTFITPNIWALIQQCWDGDYKKRPNFASISRVLQRELHYLSTDSPSNYPGLYSTTPAGSQEQSEFRLHPISNSIADTGSIILTPYGSLATSMANGVGLGEVCHSSSANETGLPSEHEWPEEHVTQELNQSIQRAQIAPLSSTANSPFRSQMGGGEIEDSTRQSGAVQSIYWNGPEGAQQASTNIPQELVNQPNSNLEEFGHGQLAQETLYVHTTDDSLVDIEQGFQDERTIGSLFSNGHTITGWRRFRSLGPNNSAVSLPTTDNGTAMTTVSVCEDDVGLIEQFPQ